MKKTLVILFFCVLSVSLNSCSDEELRGLSIELPSETGVAWRYDIITYYDGEEEKIGRLLSENFQIQPFQQRTDILRQRRTRRIDSLRTTQDSLLFSSTYLDLSENLEVEAYLDNFFRIFDTALTGAILDTLTSGAQQTGQENFTRFRNYQPGWNLFTRFDSRTTRTYIILPTQRFDLDFRLRGRHLRGTVDVQVTGLYDGSENLNTPWRDNVFAHRIRTMATFDFNLVKDDNQEIATFRENLTMFTWYNPDGGIVKRDRLPFTITVPTIPTRGPAIIDRGERWILTNVEGIDF